MPNTVSDQVSQAVTSAIANAFQNGCGDQLATQIAKKTNGSGKMVWRTPLGPIYFEVRDLYRVALIVLMAWMFWRMMGLPDIKDIEERANGVITDAGSR